MKILFALFVFLFLSSCQTQQERMMQWRAQMNKLMQNFVDVVAQSASRAAFEKNISTVQTQLGQMIDNTHELKDLSDKNPDPLLKAINSDFSRNLNQINIDLDKKNLKESRVGILNMANYCITCHTRTQTGPQNYPVPNFQALNILNEIEKGYFFAATRQFDKAMNAFDKALTQKSFSKSSPERWLKGVRTVMAISVRGKQDPSLGMEAISRLFDKRVVPKEYRVTLRGWRNHLKEWRAESSKISKLSNENILKLAQDHFNKSILSEAKKEDHYVKLLVSSSYVHYLFSERKRVKLKDEDLYFLLGRITTELGEHRFDAPPRIYFQACSNVSKNAEMKSKCTQFMSQSDSQS